MLARPARLKARRAVLVVAGVVTGVALAALVSTSGPEESNTADSNTEQAATPSKEGRPSEGLARPPDSRVGGANVWFAPAAVDEPELADLRGPLPGSIKVGQPYPSLMPGDVRTATMAMGVVGDSGSVERLLVMEESGQLFELDIGRALRGAGQPGRGRIFVSLSLSPGGTRLALGQPNATAVLDLRRLSVRLRGPGLPGWVGPEKSPETSPRSSVLTAQVRTTSDTRTAVVVEGDRRAMLVLGGERRIACCAVAGWLGPGRILVESRSADRMRLLAWDIGNGAMFLVSTISPVVDNDWYLVTSYADLVTSR